MIEILVVLVVIGVCLYLVNAYVPMAPPVKTVLNVLVVLFLVIWLLQVFGITRFQLPK
jgi:hypothetical protein